MSKTKREYWSNLIAEQEASGLTVRPFCRERGVGEHSFYQWRKRLRESQTVSFAILEPKTNSTSIAESPLELVFGRGERLRISKGADPVTLRLVLEALRA